jgi:hypothetical protein
MQKMTNRHPESRTALMGAFLSCVLLGSTVQAAEENNLINLEDAKADMLQLDRMLSRLTQQAFQPEQSTLLFGLTPNSSLRIRQLSVVLDGRTIVNQAFDAQANQSLNQGGMIRLWQSNLLPGRHELTVQLTPEGSQPPIVQQFQFSKTAVRSLIGLQWSERPFPGQRPLRLVEWIEHE